MNNMKNDELLEALKLCLNEILELKQENEILKKGNREINECLMDIVNSQKTLCDNFTRINQGVNTNFQYVESVMNNLKYELVDEKNEKNKLNIPKICSLEETVNELVSQRKSMARFGDGEFAIMDNIYRQKFQRLDQRLAERLKEVIAYEDEQFLIAIADNYGNLDQYNSPGKIAIRNYMTEKTRKEHWQYLKRDRIYHNAYITRPYAMYEDNKTDGPTKRFQNIQRIWNGRNVIFIEGALTRLGYKNDLFDNVKEIKRIEAPSVSSFDKYDEILEKALKYGNQDTLFLIAMGPSATVLAFDLYKNGFQAIDIGHIDLEYEWYLKGLGRRCEINYKYNNEFPNGDDVEEIDDDEFLNQILCVIDN